MDRVQAANGTLLGGRFTLDGEPTGGALPHHAEATHEGGEDGDARFSLTLMPTAACLSPEAAAAFVDAARRAATFSHPVVVPIVDLGDETEPPGTRFVVEPKVEGPTLSQYLSERGFLSLTETATLVGQLAEGLAAAHAAGLVHGELHPGRIQVEGSEEAPQARLHGVGWSEEITAARGSQEASPYRAPEHVGKLRGGDPKVDQYGLGVIAYELLAGCLPFTAESADLADASALRDRAPTPISEQVPGISAAVDEIVARALAFEPARRYPTILDFAAALRTLAAEDGAPSTPGPTPPPEEHVRPAVAALPGTTPAAGDENTPPPPESLGAASTGDGTATPPPNAGADLGGRSFDSQATVVVADPLALVGAEATPPARATTKKKKKKDKRKRAADIHPSAAEFADDDGPTALENPATLVAAHRVLEAGLEARELRTDQVPAPGLTPPRDGMAPGMTPPPVSSQLGSEAERARELAGAAPTPPPVMLSSGAGSAGGSFVPPQPAMAAAGAAAPVSSGAKKPWPLIAGGSLVLGGLVVWMLISLLNR